MEEAYYPGEYPEQIDNWFQSDGSLSDQGIEYFACLAANHPTWQINFLSFDEKIANFVIWAMEHRGQFDEFGIPDPWAQENV